MKIDRSNRKDNSYEISLPSHHSFVVQIEAHSEVTEEALSGRVEHVVSGRATRFHSMPELLDFIRWNLEKNRHEGK